MEKKFHRSFKDPIILFIFLLITFAINKLYIQYYFLVLFTISFYISYHKYAKVTESGITVYYGPAYYRKSIFFKWAEVSQICVDKSTIAWMESYGGRVNVSMKTERDVQALKLVLKNSLPHEVKEKINNALGKYLFPPNEAVNSTANELFIKKAPFGGFKRFLNTVSLYSESEQILNKS